MARKARRTNYTVQVRDLTVLVSRRRIKNINIYISPTAEQILVTAPLYVEDSHIMMFLERKYDWMVEHSKRLGERTQRPQYKITQEEAEKLQALVLAYARKWEPIMHVHCTHWTLRDMKTRWGSCSVNKATIRINLQLARKPEACVEYIVVHELTHLLEASHNKVFKMYMTKFLPDWKERDRMLKVSDRNPATEVR